MKKGTCALTSRIRKKVSPTSKRAQEEMVGFVLIIIIVSVILLIFLSSSLRNSNKVEIKSYEVESFIQSVLQTTSNCEDAGGFLSVQKLIFSCDDDENCLNEKTACETLDFILKKTSEESWAVEEDTPIKGYELIVISEDMNISIEEGNITKNYRGASQAFARRGKDYDVSFKLYYN